MHYVDGKILGKNGPNKALVCSSQEWDNLRGRITEARRLQELDEDRIAREERKKEISKKMTANWPNTLANMQRTRNRILLDAAEKAENDKLKEYNSIMEKRAEEKQKMLENARKLVLERSESSRILNSGLVLSETLYERNKQVEMRKIQRLKLKQSEMDETARKMKMAEAFREEQIMEKIAHIQGLQHYKQELDEQMIDVKAKRQLLHDEKIKQKEDVDDLMKEIAEIQKAEIRQSEERKASLKKEQALWKELKSKNREISLQDEIEQREINNIFQTVRDRLDKQRNEIEKKLRKDAFDKREKFAAAHVLTKIDYAKEAEILKKAIDEKEAKFQREEEFKIQKKKMLRKELQQFKKEAAQLAQEKEKKAKEISRWEKLKRLAIEDSTKTFLKNVQTQKINQQQEFRDILLQQWEERDERERLDKWDDMTAYINEKQREKDELFKLCEQAEKTCADSGRPMYPVITSIAKVKKQNGIRDQEKTVPFLQSKVPIPSVALYETSQK